MNCQEYEEKEITFRELVIFILKKWRFITIITVLAIVLSGIYMYLKLYEKRPENNTIKTNNLTEDQKREIKEIEALVIEVDELNERIEKVDLIHTDAMESSIYTLHYFVNHEKGNQLGILYQNAIETNYGQNKTINTNILVTTSGSESNFVVQLISMKEENVESTLNEIKEFINNYKKYIDNTIGENQLILVGENQIYGYSSELMQWQRIVFDSIQSKEEQLTQKLQNLTEEQKQYLNIKNSKVLKEENISQEIVSQGITNGKIVKTMFFGCIMSLFGCCIICVLIYLTSSRILTEEELQQAYKIYSFGCIYSPSKNRLFQFVDKKIQQINGIHQITNSQKENYILRNIELVCREKEIAQVCLVNLSEQLGNFTAWIGDTDTNVVIINAGYEEHNVAALEKIAEIKNIILQIKLEQTKRCEIMSVCSLCKEYGVNIIGAICYC